jgi:hypothetical protein
MQTQMHARRDSASATLLYRLGAALLLAQAAIHVLVYVGFALTPAYPGFLFLLNAAASVVLAAGVLRGFRLAWHGSAALAAATAVLFIVVRTVGLPAFHLSDWVAMVGVLPLGPLSLLGDALLLALYVVDRAR